ncbi:hypothetical protein [Vaginella massiliensis]|uniref:hypothetical protein n=1 Tax=Vaginella massiliensis TaxID=1816680 RepID=UPI000838365D|nr:hypothetical protein [Vaginella massiliensis]
MKNLVFSFSLFLIGTFAFASNEVINANEKISENNLSKTIEVLTECSTQTGTDCDGDTISVTCCRTTWEEAFNCAAAKLKAAAFAAC